MSKPAPEKHAGLTRHKIVLTGQLNSSSNKKYVGTKFSCLKYDLQCTNFEQDKTYNTTMYMRPAKSQVSMCIDPLDKASFLHTVRSAKCLNRMCCCSRTVYSALDSRLSTVNMIGECSYQNVQARTDPSLHSSHKTFCYNQ